MDTKIVEFTNKIERITSLVNKALLQIEQHRDDQPRAFQYSLAFKTNNSLNTANLLMANVLSKPHYCDSLFLLLRTMLADTISYFYLLTISRDENENDEQALIRNIKTFESDHLRFTYNSMIVYQKLYKETEEVVAKRKQNLRNSYPQYFNTDGSFKKDGKPLGIKDMVLAIAESNLDFVIEPVKIPYSLYDKYSKYEHLGMLTSYLVVRQFDDSNTIEILNELYHAVQIILLSQSSLIIPFLTTIEIYTFENLSQEIKKIKIYEQEPQ